MGKKKKKIQKLEDRYLWDQNDAAYHESGHAIAFIVYGTNFRHVDIINIPGVRGGRVHGKRRVDGIGYADPFNRIIVDLCGEIAQSHKYNLKYRRDILFSGGKSDNENVSNLLMWIDQTLRSVTYKNLPQSYHPCYRKIRDLLMMNAFKLVNDNWSQIDLIAKELSIKKKLEYWEVVKLLVENNMYDSLVAPPRIKLEPPVSKK